MVRADMDVRCERCKTEYEFEDARITEAGVTVKCTTCEHVFKVKKKALVVTVPVRPGELEQLAKAPAPPPGLPPVREWRVRQSTGNLFTFKELTTLQKWIVERKVTRDDEISLNGESWKRLGNIPELSSFFQVVDDAQKAQQLMALQQQGLFSPPAAAPSPQAQPPPQVPAGAPASIPPAQPPQLQPQAQPAAQPPPPPAAPPAPPVLTAAPSGSPGFVGSGSAIPPPPDRTAVRSAARPGAEKSGGAGKWVLAVLLTGALGGGGWYGYQYHWLPMQAQGGVTPPVAVTPPLPPKPVEPAPAPEPGSGPDGAPDAAAVAQPDTLPAAEAVAAGPEAAEETPAPEASPEPAPPPAPEEAVKPAAATEVAPTRPKERAPLGFDQLLTQGDRLRLRDRPDQALEAYDKAIELKPDRAEPVAGRGLALLDLGERSGAETAFREALRLNPRYAVAVMGLAETLRRQGKNAEAVEQYQRYLDILPNGPESSVARANIERLKE